MSAFVVIRHYKSCDEQVCKEIIKTGVMSIVNAAFIAGLTTEVHFQVMVLASAVMYIFLNVPFGVCLASVPAVIILMYILIYTTHVVKAYQAMGQLSNIPRDYMSSEISGFWVAEVYEPVGQSGSSKHEKYMVVDEADVKDGRVLPPKQHQKSVIGIVGLTMDMSSPKPGSAWLKYLAVLPSYQRKGVGTALLNETLSFCKKTNYRYITLAFSECHHAAKMFFSKQGFELKQTYHRHIVGSLVRVLKYELTKDLRADESNNKNQSMYF